MAQRTDGFTHTDLARITADTCVTDVRHFDSLPSTNDTALQLCESEIADFPALVLADRQTSGRGRGTNRWWSSAGSLAFSILLDMDALQIPPAIRPRISLAAGIAVCEAVEQFLSGRSLKLKWPNDVLFEQRKVCGILAEVSPQRQGILVLGIGINVNNSIADAPTEIRSIATSVQGIAGRTISPCDVLVAVLQQLELRVRWVGEQREQLQQHWQSRCMLTGQTVQIEIAEGCITGECLGVDQGGALILHTPLGQRRLVSGVIKHWGLA